jgi:long-chain acyl-CoA synthetase
VESPTPPPPTPTPPSDEEPPPPRRLESLLFPDTQPGDDGPDPPSGAHGPDGLVPDGDGLREDDTDDGDRPAVIDGDHETSRRELRALVDRHVETLTGLGVTAGQGVAVSRADDASTIAAWFAIWRLGGVLVPLNPKLTTGERQRAVAAVGPRVLLDDRETSIVDGAPGAFSTDTALVSFTSGTTGPPTPVPLTHVRVLGLMDGVLASLRSGGGRTGTRGDDRRAPMPNLVPVSLSLWAGIYNVLFAFRVGAPVVLLSPFTTTGFAEAVVRHQIRSTVLPPAAMTMLADDETIEDLEPLRLVRSITAPLSPLSARRFRDRFGVTVLNGYGQTELGGEVIGWTAADGRAHGDTKLGAVGRPHPGIEVRIVDDDGSLLSAAGNERAIDGRPDEVGELQVRAAGREPSALAGTDRLTDDGFLRTGDLARIDADGFVWIEGRMSEMINRGGLKVFPAEVEEVLRLHPAVRDVAVVALADERLGEVPAAGLVLAGWSPATGEGATDAVDAAALEAHCRRHLAPYKVPISFTVVERIPRNEIGKVQRHRLADAVRHTEGRRAP